MLNGVQTVSNASGFCYCQLLTSVSQIPAWTAVVQQFCPAFCQKLNYLLCHPRLCDFKTIRGRDRKSVV